MTIEYSWPEPDYLDIIKQRYELLQRLRETKHGFQDAANFYQYHPTDFINDWCWTYDPRRQGREKSPYMPFVLFEKQAEFINFLNVNFEERRPVVCEKSRDMGVSWLVCAYAAWRFIYFPGFKQGFGSNKFDDVDELGNLDTLLEKIRFIINYLPVEMRPRRRMLLSRLINDSNGAVIVGQGGDNIGRGGRNTIYYKDESAAYERAEAKESALSANSDFQVDISTHRGANTLFYQKTRNPIYAKFTFHWTSDPRKSKEWYARECEKYKSIPTLIAREYDIDPHASKEGAVIPAKHIRAAIGFQMEKSGVRRACLDVGEDGADSSAIIIGEGSVIEFCDEWHGKLTSETGQRAYALCVEHDVEELRWDKLGVGAGVSGEIDNIRKKCAADGEEFQLKSAFKFAASGKPRGAPLIKDVPNDKMFKNLSAQCWWTLRIRFENVFEHVMGIKSHHPDDMISLMLDDDSLVDQLSQATWKIGATGKIEVDKTGGGGPSPNKADALAMYFVEKMTMVVV